MPRKLTITPAIRELAKLDARLENAAHEVREEMGYSLNIGDAYPHATPETKALYERAQDAVHAHIARCGDLFCRALDGKLHFGHGARLRGEMARFAILGVRGSEVYEVEYRKHLR